jgi:hypothetical protein
MGIVSCELIGLLQEVLGAARLIVGKFAAYAPRGKTQPSTDHGSRFAALFLYTN